MRWLAVLAAALLFLTADSARQLAAFRAATALGEQGRPAPAYDAASPTGRVNGQRNRILQSADGYHWVMQTQRMIATGEWRLRQVDYDNAPDGREAHWCSPLHWWLALVAWADHAVSGRPWLASVESAALYAGPLLLGLFLLAVVPWAARRLGAWPAALLAAGLVTVVPLSGEFGTGSFDHHGAAAACALLAALFLLAGWTAPAEQARRDFIAAGIAGAAGLWINAATLIPVLAGIGAGALLAQGLARAEKSAPVDPRLWRTWGFAGGAASLFFYLVEYFPSHLGWRLEVNHPLHALAWAGAGDLLARWGGRQYSRGALISILAVLAPLVAVLVAPARTFVIADRFLWTLHVDYISEFSPLFASWPGLEALVVRINVLPLLGLAAVWLMRGGFAPGARALLVLALPAAGLVTLLALSQQRWVHLAAAMWLAVLAATAMAVAGGPFAWTRPRRIAAGLFLALVFLPYPLRAGWDALHRESGLSRENIRQFAVRDLAFWLRRRTGADPVTLLSGPTATTELIYHGGFRGVGTLYWENQAGLRALVDIYGATDAHRARQLIQQHGVTHLVLLPWGSFAGESARLAQGTRASAASTTPTFAQELANPGSALPDWLRPLPYRLPEAEAFKGQVALVLEVAPDQSPVDATVRQAQYLAAMGSPGAAQTLVTQALAADPDHALGLITQAQLQRAARDREAHAATMRRVEDSLEVERLPGGARIARIRQTFHPFDRRLEPADRVALALELAAAGAREPARSQLERCWREADDARLRRLPPTTLAHLLRLTRDFNVSPPPELFALAESLHAADRPPGS